MNRFQLAVELETERSSRRIASGEFLAISPCNAIVALTEELGEAAELVRVIEGWKPKFKFETTGDPTPLRTRVALMQEIVQIASICERFHTHLGTFCYTYTEDQTQHGG